MKESITDVINTEPNNSEEELARVRKCLEIAKELVSERSQQAGRNLSYHVTTFGCQMNIVHGI